MDEALGNWRWSNILLDKSKIVWLTVSVAPTQELHSIIVKRASLKLPRKTIARVPERTLLQWVTCLIGSYAPIFFFFVGPVLSFDYCRSFTESIL